MGKPVSDFKTFQMVAKDFREVLKPFVDFLSKERTGLEAPEDFIDQITQAEYTAAFNKKSSS